jgi:hypothetical protein
VKFSQNAIFKFLKKDNILSQYPLLPKQLPNLGKRNLNFLGSHLDSAFSLVTFFKTETKILSLFDAI